jgi:chromosome segregation ATPase
LREELAKMVDTLEQKYNLLTPRVKDLEKREQDLLRRNKEMESEADQAEVILKTLRKEKQYLLAIGFSPEVLAGFSQGVQSVARRHDIAPAELRGRLLQELENLDQGLTLETLIQERQAQLEELERSVALARKEQKSLQAVVTNLKHEQAGLEANIRNTREKVGKEIEKIVPVARDAINSLVGELRHGNEEVRAEVKRLKDEAIEVGKEIGRYHAVVEANQWLSDLASLMRGEEGLDGKQVRIVTLAVLRGLSVWAKHNQTNNLGFVTRSLYLDSLIKELEEWKV